MLFFILTVAAGCGGSDKQSSATTTAASADQTPEWVRELAAKPGPNVNLITSTSDYGIGSNRIAFLVVRPNNQIVQKRRATVYVGRGDTKTPTRVRARLVPIGVPGAGHKHGDVPPTIYVATVDLPSTGSWWIVAEPDGETIQAAGIAAVRAKTVSPAIGAKAYPSRNPTLADAPAAEITTARPPDTALLRYSIADSLKTRAPFVVVFATPKFCQTRTCGPVVEVVDAVRTRFESSGVRFIHVEVYRNNDPQQGANRWMEEWKLESEPWVFVVDRSGVIRARFEGAVSVGELAAAVRQLPG
jgi:hypothetical protein